MYNIDINFLKDRKLDASGSSTIIRKKATPMSEKLPLLIGGGVAIAFLAATGGALLFVNARKSTLEKEMADLQAEITKLQGQSAEIQKIDAEITGITKETDAFVSVFTTVKPWSALLMEIGELIPANVQIQSITQSEGKKIVISGIAQSYEEVNDFALTLKKSKFINPEQTSVVSSTKIPHPNSVEIGGGGTSGGAPVDATASAGEGKPLVELPSVINYTINTELSDIPASKLMAELRSKGGIGLVSRIEQLQQKGAIKP